MTTKHIGKKIDIFDIKKIELEILNDVLLFCKNKKLRVFAAYGTLLGAVRHNGFIPWDDDVDLFMLREDYEFFKKNYSSNFLEVACTEKNKLYPFVFLKVYKKDTIVLEPNIKEKYGKTYGVYIDVFPLDFSSDCEKKFTKKAKRLEFFHNLLIFKHKKRLKRTNIFKTFISDVLYLLLLFVPIKAVKKRITRIISKDCENNSNYLSNFSISTYIRKERYKYEDFSSAIMLPFETIEIPVPIGYKTILTTIYGDYMQLPPVEKQICTHGIQGYYKEDKN